MFVQYEISALNTSIRQKLLKVKMSSTGVEQVDQSTDYSQDVNEATAIEVVEIGCDEYISLSGKRKFIIYEAETISNKRSCLEETGEPSEQTRSVTETHTTEGLDDETRDDSGLANPYAAFGVDNPVSSTPTEQIGNKSEQDSGITANESSGLLKDASDQKQDSIFATPHVKKGLRKKILSGKDYKILLF